MITSKNELLDFLNADKKALHKEYCKKPTLFGDPIWKFQISLRYVEYYKNCGYGVFTFFKFYYHLTIYKLLLIFLGFTIYPNNFGKGLSIAHRGTVVVNESARIGNNCRIHTCVNIGSNIGGDGVPKIGDNVYIGPGVKIYGDIKIGNKIIIGANAVVNKDFIIENSVIAGVPAKIIGSHDLSGYLKG